MGWNLKWCPGAVVHFPLQAPQPSIASVKQGVSVGRTHGQQARSVLRFVLRSAMGGAE